MIGEVTYNHFENGHTIMNTRQSKKKVKKIRGSWKHNIAKLFLKMHNFHRFQMALFYFSTALVLKGQSPDQSLSHCLAPQSFIIPFFDCGCTKIFRTRMAWSAVTSLQAGLRQNVLTEKVTVQVWPSKTVTARLDGNVFISLSNSSRDYFMGS